VTEVEGAIVNVESDTVWTSTGEVRLKGMMPAMVTLDGGRWDSEDAVNVGYAGGTGQVTINPGGYWHAQVGYALDLVMSRVDLEGDTLEYGTQANPLDFDPGKKLTSFTSGRLITWGSYLGDIDLRPGASMTTSHVTGNVINGGLFLPGHSPAASLIDGNYTQESLATLEMEILGDIAGDEYDTLEVTGDLSLDGLLMIRLYKYSPGLNQTFGLFDWTWSAPDGTFSKIEFDRIGYAGVLDYSTGVLTITETPEPTALALLAVGAIALLRGRRRLNAE